MSCECAKGSQLSVDLAKFITSLRDTVRLVEDEGSNALGKRCCVEQSTKFLLLQTHSEM